jgi:hypothetical protein
MNGGVLGHMRNLKISVILIAACISASAQEIPADAIPAAPTRTFAVVGVPAVTPEPPALQKMKSLVKRQVNHAIDGNGYPSVDQWRPLTPREKFREFLHSTYSPRTFLNAAIDEAADRAKGRPLNPEYEKGFRGVGQRYGIELATNETDVFFQSFLLPTLLKQDPRYYRNPDLPFFPRVLYSMSRVLITRTDNGGQAFNASRILGSVASRAVADLYVPGARQGMQPLSGCVRFNLLRDAGMNLLHEFWPDLRRKLFHR